MPRGKATKSLALIHRSAEILQEIQPATVRAVCYQLFNQGLIPSMAKKETNRVGTQLVYAREEGLIPWRWIVDETRRPERLLVWDDIDECVEATQASYRRDYWLEQDYHVEVWSEKGTVRGTLKPVLDRYQVTFRAMHGFSSATEIHNAAEQAQQDDREWLILYVGDWDPSGMHMSAVDAPGRLEQYGASVAFERLALLPEDHAPLQSLSFPASDKRADPRYQWFVGRYGHTCWELDAMNPNELRRRVEDAIVQMIDQDAWAQMQVVEQAETDSLRKVLGRWQATRNGRYVQSSHWDYDIMGNPRLNGEIYFEASTEIEEGLRR
jgi:hypothetical protein